MIHTRKFGKVTKDQISLANHCIAKSSETYSILVPFGFVVSQNFNYCQGMMFGVKKMQSLTSCMMKQCYQPVFFGAPISKVPNVGAKANVPTMRPLSRPSIILSDNKTADELKLLALAVF